MLLAEGACPSVVDRCEARPLKTARHEMVDRAAHLVVPLLEAACRVERPSAAACVYRGEGYEEDRGVVLLAVVREREGRRVQSSGPPAAAAYRLARPSGPVRGVVGLGVRLSVVHRGVVGLGEGRGALLSAVRRGVARLGDGRGALLSAVRREVARPSTGAHPVGCRAHAHPDCRTHCRRRSGGALAAGRARLICQRFRGFG